MSRLSDMLHLATKAHNGQFDKAGKPYILHPLKVMHYLKTDDEELMVIALGHDLVEDTFITPGDLMLTYDMGYRITTAIIALTKKEGQSYEEYKEQVFGNVDAMRVKMADLRHNMDIRRLKGITPEDIERTVRYYAFYEEIKERLEKL